MMQTSNKQTFFLEPFHYFENVGRFCWKLKIYTFKEINCYRWFPVSDKIIGRISGKISIRYNPNKYLDSLWSIDSSMQHASKLMFFSGEKLFTKKCTICISIWLAVMFNDMQSYPTSCSVISKNLTRGF